MLGSRAVHEMVCFPFSKLRRVGGLRADDDEFEPVNGAEYALGGGEWTTLNPLDGVSDSLDERFRAEVEIDTSGEHLLGVRASDQAGNRGAGHISVDIP